MHASESAHKPPMTAISYRPVTPTPEAKERILKYVSLLWSALEEMVKQLPADSDIAPRFFIAYEAGVKVYCLSISQETKPLVMAAIRELAAKASEEEPAVFCALCTHCFVTEVAPGGAAGVRTENIMLHIETPTDEWLTVMATIERRPDGASHLGARRDLWLDQHGDFGVQGQMLGFFPNSNVTRTHAIN